MNLSLLTESTLETKLDAWQHADYYELHSHDEGWSSACLAILEHKVTEDEVLAFMNLVGLLAIEGEGWNKSASNLKIKEFLHFFSYRGYLSTLESHQVSIESFWTDYLAICNGIKNSPKAAFFKNRIQIPFENPFIKENILWVHIFDDRWNQRLYFLKLQDTWAIFEWGTTV